MTERQEDLTRREIYSALRVLDVLDTYHPEERLIGEAHVVVNCRQYAKYEADEHHHKTASYRTQEHRHSEHR